MKGLWGTRTAWQLLNVHVPERGGVGVGALHHASHGGLGADRASHARSWFLARQATSSVAPVRLETRE